VEQNARAATLLGMGKVSHDIGNLAASLYATLGFGEMAIHGIRDHLQKTKPDRQMRLYVDTIEPIFRELKESVDRLVGYSRLISDISAGRPVRPEFQLGALADVVYQAASYFEWQGRSQHIEIRYELEENAPETQFDEVFVSRIVQNLVGNAIKAVRETLPVDLPLIVDDEPTEALGWITVGYQFSDGTHRITVRDTGPGMSEVTIRQILSGTARSQWERAGGSGWGLRIVQELAGAMGGEVQIQSVLGHGAEFCVVLPHGPGEQESGDEKIPAQAAA
jgi:signal transduction histidine kinase